MGATFESFAAPLDGDGTTADADITDEGQSDIRDSRNVGGRGRPGSVWGADAAGRGLLWRWSLMEIACMCRIMCRINRSWWFGYWPQRSLAIWGLCLCHFGVFGS